MDCEVCGMESHHGRPRCFHCSALDEAFGRLLLRNPKAADSWASAKQLEAAFVVRMNREETDNEYDKTGDKSD